MKLGRFIESVLLTEDEFITDRNDYDLISALFCG